MNLKNRILLLSFFTVSAAVAQETDTIQLGNVLIENDRISQFYSRTNRNISIITADQIRNLPVKSVQELLSWVSGVDVRQRGPWGAQSDISIQGGTFEQTLVLVDGVRMIDPQTGHNTMNIPVPLEAIERIEVLKGPAARIYGINALTGAINIVTKKSTGDFYSARIYAGSSFEKDTSNGQTFSNYGAAVSAGIQRGNFNQVLSLGSDRGNGYRYNTVFENYRLYTKMAYEFKDSSVLQLQGGYVNNFFGANAFYAAPGDKESEETVETGLASAKWIKKSGKIRIVPEMAWRYNYDHYVYIRQKPSVYQNRHFTHSLAPALHVSGETGFGQWAIGVEHRLDKISSSNLGKRERNNTGISAELLYNKHKKFYGMAGIYGLYNSAFGWGFFPGIELGYEWTKDIKIFANAGTAQRIPSFTDLYYRGPSNVSNPLLLPETSKNAEIGFRRLGKGNLFQATVFLRDINHMIDWVKDSLTAPWSPVNYNTNRTIGFDINGKQLLYENKNFKATLTGGYTYLDPGFVNEVAKAYSKNVLENLNHQVISSLQLNVFQSLGISFGGRYIVRSNMNAYTLLDLHVHYQRKNITAFADINNLGNAAYREIAAVPMPPRWLAFGLRISGVKTK